MGLRDRRWLAAALVLGVCPACQNGPVELTPASSKTIVFDDIPAPADFQLISDKSNVQQNPAFRSGQIVYRGLANQDILRDWYRKAMVGLKWTEVSASGAGPYTLKYEKGGERCSVRIEAPRDETLVTILLEYK
jgi:hypothetical protein